MRSPVYVRALTDPEYDALLEGLRSPEAFTLRRAQIVLASARRQTPAVIAAALSCGAQTVRTVVHAFNACGLAALQRQSSAPKTVQPLFDAARAEALRALLHRSPRELGFPTSIWTLKLVAEAAYREGITPYQVSIETIRQAFKVLKVSWRRAKHWIDSPDPAYAKKSGAATG
jgi:transposase